MVKHHAKIRAKASQRAWEAWVVEALSGGAGLAHRFARGEVSAPSFVDEASMKAKQDHWAAWWQKGPWAEG